MRRWRERTQLHEGSTPPAEFVDSFTAAVLDDLDTPRALQVVRDVEKSSDLNDGEKAAFFIWADQFLGLDLTRAPEVIEVPAEVQTLVEQRKAAREAKQWQLSDELRDQVAQLGWAIKDTPEGQTLEPLR
ncbi:MAG: hypothetical protein RIS75_953 [Actinomycetota bacterium]